MVGKEDTTSNSRGPAPLPGARKTFWRSASWSASRTASQDPSEEESDSVDPSGNNGNNSITNRQNRRIPAVPLTPRSQQKRSCLPPLQPLAISRRSLEEWPKAGSDDIGEWPGPPTPSGNRGGERLKLDLSTIQQESDRNGGLVKRDKIAFFDKECSKVAEHIYLGGDAVARDMDILKQNGITHVLNCVGFVCPEYFKKDFIYRTLWLQDSPSEDITSILYDVFDYFEDVREKGGRVFVHCCQGVSRSTSLVIAYRMWREGQSFDDAFQYVKAVRGIADPNMGFACQLLQCQKRVHAFPLSPSSLLRMYRIAPHSPYDPLHLVPKMLNDPSPSALDSRGAFIVHVPSALYVWIGKNCEAIMERDARGAVGQIVRYERVRVPIEMVKEGGEPAYFWDAFSNLLPLMEKSDNGVEVGESAVKSYRGERKVDSYDVDFEIFQKAVKGGFVPSIASSENEHETHLPARESSWSMLRRKFASVNLKEFVSAPKILSRVYSDSMMIVHSPANTLSQPSSLSVYTHSSPPYRSSDYMSSDSSTSSKCFSESLLDFPSKSSVLPPVSSTLSTFSNLSLFSSKTSSQPISSDPKSLGSKSTSLPCSLLVSSPSKNIPLSLAERRGSLSKTLKLPVVTDDIRVANTFSSSLPNPEDGIRIDKNLCSPSKSDNIENNSKSKDGAKNGEEDSTQQCKVKVSPGRLGSADCSNSCNKEACEELQRILLLREALGSTVVNNRIGEGGSGHCNQMKPLVFCWPSLEKIAIFGRTDLSSEAVFAIFGPSTDLCKKEDRILYFWVGRSFDLSKSQNQFVSSRELGEVQEIDWNQAGCNVLASMGLPNDTAIQIVKEDEEPEEFLALFSSL